MVGDGNPGSEKYIGTYDTKELCAIKVLQKEYTANGATYEESTSKCWAEFDMTYSNGNAQYITCKFGKTIK